MDSIDDPGLKFGLRESQDAAYAIVLVEGAVEAPCRSGLSHPAAMTLAEELQREGKTVRVMHVTKSGSYEVDRYPLR
jgi:hypothetical protein